MHLHLLRHTEVSVDKSICYGQLDVDLKPTFYSEVSKIKSTLSHKGLASIPYIYSSPLSRCQRLARQIADEFTTDSRLMELDFGDWEGWTWDEIYDTTEGRIWFSDYTSHPTLHGESYLELISRTKDFLSSLPKIHSDILIVTHAGVIRAIMHLLEGVSIEEVFSRNIAYGELISYPDVDLSFLKN